MRILLLVTLALWACDDGGAGVERFGADGSATDARVRDARLQPPDSAPRDAGDLDARVGPIDAFRPRPDAQPIDGPPPDAPAPDAAPPCPELDPPLEPWRRPFDTPDTADGRESHHSAVEPVINPGQGFVLAGKFAYGTFSYDLEHENVDAYLRVGECGEWISLGRQVTDADGRLEFQGPDDLPLGRHDFVLFVPGDGTRAVGSVWVVEPGTAAVVFDVDGTLTIGDSEIFQEVLLGSDPEMYAAADRVVGRYAEQGYFVVYTTGRPYFLNPSTRRWLAAHGFPRGPVRTTDSVSQSLPTEGGVQTFKLDYLRGLIDGPGLTFPAAYGNASTDICAYAMAGIDPDDTWIIGANGGHACDGYGPTHAVVDYPSHLPTLDALPPAP